MSQVKSEFKNFYEQATRCEDLERGGSAYNPLWTCRKTGQPCGPGNCPKHPWLRKLMPKAEPKTESKIHETRNEMVESGSVFSRSSEKRAVLEPDLSYNSTSLSREETSPKISSRNHAKSKTRAHTKKSILKRVTVTFIEKKTKQLQRWGIDMLFSQKTRKTSILEFRRGSGVRFYFGPEVEDENAKQCVRAWFESLAVYDPENFVNAAGSPENFSIDILDES